jgi:hypothetical protein
MIDHKEIPDRDEVLLVLKAMYALAQKGWRFESDSLGMHVYAINGTTRLVASGPNGWAQYETGVEGPVDEGLWETHP